MVNPKVQEMVDLAAIDVNRLRNASTCRAAREAWTDFLEHSNRAINRLEGFARRTNQSAKYNTLVREEVWASELTKYMRVARNTHEHGVIDTQIDDRYNERVVFPNGHIMGGPTVIGINEAGEEVYMPPIGPMEFSGSPDLRVVTLKPGIMLVSIQDKSGKIVRPPHVPGLESEDEPASASVAREYLKWVIAKVATFA